ncbi:uncharacterized protein PHACADRAFT_206377 [Phanerochaete carnosa HHB-10118-sp]|uniref:DUF6535 domain-containing protein n=1 Tax=Phanerochaete carnosa (strain HHB-10118-sp) TaxID=650164 RepID=K5X3T1_PHACS|nr:uncharacterized protein PHACADRAFT_206377 [Phanerochaete carnosa HHB-10118-sp]EKM57472.1 hypothetical protein PHACADRAFT_206377 [Phanerochaete carnosa HHB-10118-sp]
MPLPNFNTDHNKPTGGWPQFSETASGWEAIERHVIKHDTAEMRDYAEDIDTLLVFAGLFSAILTGFIVQTYPMLTEDDSVTTNQLLALSVSARLRATSTIVPSTMNSTLFSLLDTAPFVPSTAVRSINILFFLSLIFSLAAALFGILAKQWLREYLKWNSALPSARENVLVRQVRIEAWEAWNVAATISSIPALLELAMVLFLTGIVVLLWTLDDIVAKVVTVFAVLFLLVASAFTVLPIFFTRCPYKSPTAWACVSAYYAITIIPAYCFAIVKYHRHLLFRSWQRFYRPILAIHMRETWVRCAATWPTSWREWDLQSCRDISPKLDGKSFDRNEVRKAVCKILSEMSPCPSQLEQVAADAVLKDISETSYLVRALSWVQQSSQDPRTLDFVKQCIESIHPEPPSALSTFDFIDAAVNVVATRCVLLALQENLLTHSHSALLHGSESALCLLRPFPGE